MNILLLSWRDIFNPKSGGAEILTWEIAKRWIKKGHSVTLFTSEYPNSLKEEVAEGVKIIRSGHPDLRFLFASVHFRAFFYYKKSGRNVDAVVDQIHGMPFFTPLYVRKRKVALICEVADNLWFDLYGFFFGFLGRFIEILYLKFIYARVPFVTISQSTKEELIRNGVNEKHVTVLPMGLTVPRNIKKNVKKEHSLTLIYVGRLSKTKGIEDSIYALKKVLKIYKDAKLWIVGRGEEDYLRSLKKLVEKLGLRNEVIFFGFVSDEKKFELMAKAHILLAPSTKEGWGLIVPEAGFVGTPSIVYNSLGLRDIIIDRENGIVVKDNNPVSMANEAVNLFRDKKFYQKLREKIFEDSRSYSWDKTADVALKAIV